MSWTPNGPPSFNGGCGMGGGPYINPDPLGGCGAGGGAYIAPKYPRFEPLVVVTKPIDFGIRQPWEPIKGGICRCMWGFTSPLCDC